MFTAVGDLLKTLPRRSKTPQAIVALHVRRAFEEILPKVCSDLPGEVLTSVKASTFKNNTLMVKAPNLISVELQMRAGGLIQGINQMLGRRVVSKIKFRL